MARTTTTSKKPTTKKKTVAKATAKRTTTVKKTVSNKATVTKVVAKTDYYLDQTRLIQRLSIAIFAALAVAAATLMTGANSVFTLGYMVRDQIASQLAGRNVFAPAFRTLWEVQTKWLLVTLLAVSALFAILQLTRWRARAEQGIKDGVQPKRWLEIGVTGYLLVELTALLSGVTDVMTLKLAGGLVLAAAAFGWLAERENAGQQKPVWRAFSLSAISALLALALIKVTAISTLLFGMIRAPWYVYALYAVLILGFVGHFLNQWLQFRQRTAWKNPSFVERNYALIGLVTKVLFAVVLIIGLQK